MKLFTAIRSVLHNKCPRCHQGDVFKHRNPYSLKNMFNMHSRCNHCHLLYEKETGFFYGAMFVSYGLSAAWFIAWFIIQNLFLNLNTLDFVIGFCVSIIILSPLSIRWSRLIWLNIFYSYKSDVAKAADK